MIRVLLAGHLLCFAQIISQNRFICLTIHFQVGKVPVSKQFDQILAINEMNGLFQGVVPAPINTFASVKLVYE